MEEISIKLFTKNERRCYNFYCEEGMPMRECMPDESLLCPQKHTALELLIAAAYLRPHWPIEILSRVINTR